MFKIRKICADDVDILGVIGRKTFEETFAEHNTDADMKQYMDKRMSRETLLSELENPLSDFYLAESEGIAVGYLKLNRGAAQTELKNTASMEVERIYVLREFFGQKAGQRLLDLAITGAKNEGAKFLWLGVWEKNFRAIKFYEKNGFVPFGRHDFMLGNDRQIDIMMKREFIGAGAIT